VPRACRFWAAEPRSTTWSSWPRGRLAWSSRAPRSRAGRWWSRGRTSGGTKDQAFGPTWMAWRSSGPSRPAPASPGPRPLGSHAGPSWPPPTATLSDVLITEPGPDAQGLSVSCGASTYLNRLAILGHAQVALAIGAAARVEATDWIIEDAAVHQGGLQRHRGWRRDVRALPAGTSAAAPPTCSRCSMTAPTARLGICCSSPWANESRRFAPERPAWCCGGS
jgi:hypothetical protein